jgi:hypothetical protein
MLTVPELSDCFQQMILDNTQPCLQALEQSNGTVPPLEHCIKVDCISFFQITEFNMIGKSMS